MADEFDELLEALEELEESEGVEDPAPPAEDPAPDPEPEADPEPEHDAAQDLLDADKWSYAWPEKISADNVESTTVTIATTQVLYDNAAVSKYKIYYSDTTIAELADYDKIEDKTVSPDKMADNMVYLTLAGLEAGKTYYIVIAPVAPNDPLGDEIHLISDELKVTTSAAIVDTSNDKIFTNVSYTYDNGMVRLVWKPEGRRFYCWSTSQTSEWMIIHESRIT